MKKNLTILIACCLSLYSCKEDLGISQPVATSQPGTEISELGVWTRKADRPGFGGAYQGVQFTINNKVYVGFGASNASNDSGFWEYDPATNTWEQKSSGESRLAFSQMASFSIGDKGYYATGGQEGFAYIYTKEFFEFDPKANRWTRKAEFPGTGRTLATGFSAGNKGYVGLGYTLFRDEDPDQVYHRDFWEYDPASDCWTRKADFPGGVQAAASFGLGDHGYVKTAGNTPDFWRFDPKANQWSKKADFPGAGRRDALAFAINSKGYFGTGTNTETQQFDQYLKDFYEYNPATDEWRQMADFAGGRTSGAFGAATSTRGYVKTGDSDDQVERVDFWEFNPPK